MKKRKFNIILITDDNKKEYNLLGEYDKEKNIIYYNESGNLITNMIIDLNNKILTRENKDYLIKYKLIEKKETTNEIIIKDLDKTIELKIKTEKFEITENKIEIEYILLDSNEKVTYIINM